MRSLKANTYFILERVIVFMRKRRRILHWEKIHISPASWFSSGDGTGVVTSDWQLYNGTKLSGDDRNLRHVARPRCRSNRLQRRRRRRRRWRWCV